jgi:hypothetical protein
MSAFGRKADIIQRKADIKKCPLMTEVDIGLDRILRPVVWHFLLAVRL